MAEKERTRTAYGPAKRSEGGFEIPDVANGTYQAIVNDVWDREGEWNGETFDQYVVEWALDDQVKENGDPVTLAQFVRIPGQLVNDGLLNEESNLYKLIEALGVCEDMEEPEVEPNDWIGKGALIKIENKEIKSGQNAGTARPRITNVMSLPKKARPAARTTTARPEPVAAGRTKSRPAEDEF